MVFDPDQDPEEKRAVRQNYRSLTKKIEEKQGNLNDISAAELLTQVQKADRLFVKVKGPQEATLDSHLLLMASNMGAQKARAMKSGSGAFDVDDFVSKLLRFMGGQRHVEEAMSDGSGSDSEGMGDNTAALDWDRIGRKAMAKSRRVPVMGFMLGPLSIEQKKRSAMKRSKLEKNKEDERKPQELKEEDIARSTNETTRNVQVLSKILEDPNLPEKINLFKFVINPDNFAQSVENIFYLSFLIRDGLVALDFEDGEPLIYLCDAPITEEGHKKNQMVFEFDMATWKHAIEVFNITEPMIPTREPGGVKLAGKWYG
ncbi:hypothetical protein CPC08DRAFT_733951 [Agrocybe pediades]|nr:hypothetical protein CPC08DRAFT_733951 [Agrocybe pediades]